MKGKMKGNGMKKEENRLERLEKILSRAYREQTGPKLPPEWRGNLMQDIRGLHDASEDTDIQPAAALAFGKAILPFACTAAFVALVCVIYTVTFIPGIEQELLAVLTEDPSGLLSTQTLGL